jgi:hypothetical protein
VTTGGPVGVALIVADGLLGVALPGEIVTTATIAELLHSTAVVCEPRSESPQLLLGREWNLYTISATS